MEVKVRLKCGSPAACGELAGFISGFKGVRSTQISYRVRGDILEVAVVGPPEQVARTKRVLMEAYRRWREIGEFRSGRSGELSLETLSLLTGRPIAPRVLELLLRVQGYAVEAREDRLVTDAPPDLVVRLAREVSEEMERVSRSYPRAARGLRILLAALSVLGHDIEEALGHLKEAGVVEENHKLKLKVEWSSLLAKLHALEPGAGGSEAGGQEGDREGAYNQGHR